MPFLENFLVHDLWQYELIQRLFAFSTALLLAGLVWFGMTARTTAPGYRLSASLAALRRRADDGLEPTLKGSSESGSGARTA